MKALLSSFLSPLTGRNLRPVLLVAGAAAATAGAYYLYSNFGDRKWRPTTNDASAQTQQEVTSGSDVSDSEAQASSSAVPSTDWPSTPIHPQDGPQSESSTDPASTSTEGSYTPVHPQEAPQTESSPDPAEQSAPEAAVDILCAKATEVPGLHKPLMNKRIDTPVQPQEEAQSESGPEPASPSTDRPNTPVQPQEEAQSESGPEPASPSTDRPDTPVQPQEEVQSESSTDSASTSTEGSYTLVQPQEDLQSQSSTDSAFSFTDWPDTPIHPQEEAQSESGPEPASPSTDGPNTPVHPQEEDPYDSSTDSASPSADRPSTPVHPQEAPQSESSPDPAEQSAPEAAVDILCAEAREVPAVYNYLMNKRIDNIPLKLTAVRQAFTVILTDQDHCHHIAMAGRTILGTLANLNDRNVTFFQEKYDWLLLVAQNPLYHDVIRGELAQFGIQHFNFVDVVCEWVVLGLFGRLRPHIFPDPHGFLGHLMAMYLSVSATFMESRPMTEEFLLLCQREMKLLLENIFTMEESLYADPGSLATVVWDSLQHHIGQITGKLEAT